MESIMVNTKNTNIVENEKSSIDILLDIQRRAESKGVKVDFSTLLGYIYQIIAKESADEKILQILHVSSFDKSLILDSEIESLAQCGKEILEYILPKIERHFENIPIELAKLVLQDILHISDQDLVYLPYCSIASVADACPEAHYIGEEMDPIIWAVGNICAYIKHNNVVIKRVDSWAAKAKCDRIFTILYYFPNGHNLAEVINALYSRLNNSGEMAIVLPAGFLNPLGDTDEYNEIYKSLLKHGAIDNVILLPHIKIKGTVKNVRFAVLHITKCSEISVLLNDGAADVTIRNDYVTFSDYSDFVIDNRKYGSICKLDLEAIKDAYETSRKHAICDEPYQSFRIDKKIADLLNDKNINLNPKYHLIREKILSKKEEGVEYVPLSELVDIYDKAYLLGGGVQIPVVRIQDLADSILSGTKDFLNLEAEKRKEKKLPLLMKDDLLLVATDGKAIKPTIFKLTEGFQISYSENIAPLQLKSDMVSLEYLQCELSSAYVLEQIGVYQLGTSRPYIRRTDLTKILIRVPKRKEEQVRIVKERKDTLTAELLNKLGIENEELRNTRYNEFVREMRVRKHALGQVLNELDPAIDTLLRLEKKNNGVLRGSDIISERFNYSVEDYLQRVRFLVTKVMTMVNSLTNEYVPKGVMKEYKVVQLLEEYFQKYTIPKGYEVSIKHEAFTSDLHIPEGILLPDGSVTERLDVKAGDNMDLWEIKVCKEDFFQVLDNIISNVKRYGFTENRQDYCIRIEMEDVRDDKQPMVAIHIKNNGNPLPKGMNPEQVFLYGEGSAQGTGIGGWQIKQIVEGMDGKVELRTEDEAYPIDYVLSFPDKSVLIIDVNEE